MEEFSKEFPREALEEFQEEFSKNGLEGFSMEFLKFSLDELLKAIIEQNKSKIH